MAITNANYWPLGSTIQKTPSLITTSNYRNFGILSVNPTNGNTVLIYRLGTLYVGDVGSIYIRQSADGGANWGAESQIISEASVDLRYVAGGYNSTGRLIVFFGRYNPVTTTWLSISYGYSDNDGITWSSLSTLNTQTNTTYSPFGQLVDVGNNIHYQPWFGNNGSTYTLNLYKSSDGGLTFPTIISVYSGTQLLAEPSMVNLGGGCFLLLARINNGSTFRQFKSEDNCATWTDQGNTSFETWSTSPNMQAPPWLSFINYQGVGIVACYFTRRDTNPPQLKVVFGLAKDLLNATTGWNATTIKTINSYPAGYTRSGYQSFFHPLNQYKGIGVCFEVAAAFSYPKIVLTPYNGMLGVLSSLMP
jgi:hypothetical protein